MTKAKLTRIPKRVLACVLAVLMALSCLTMLPFTGFAAVQHLDIETPAVVQDDGMYYAFGNAGAYYTSNDLTQWSAQQDYLGDGAIDDINLLYGHLGTVTQEDLKSPEVVQIGGTYYLYLSIMKGSTSMIVRAPSIVADNPGGPYADFDAVLETGFARNDSTDVIQGYFNQAYTSPSDKPDDVAGWSRGTCYYFSNFLGFNYQWFTEELPRAYAPSIAQVGSDYYMVYGYRNGGIWLQKLQSDGLIDFTWSGDNWSRAGEEHRYTVKDSYDQESLVTNGEIFDPYFGQLLVPTTEAGDTDTTASSVSRAGEEPELYVANGQVYLQVTYGGPDNSDGYNVRSYTKVELDVGGVTAWNFVDMNNNSAWRNVSGNLISGASTTGHKLMGDYNLPGTTNGLYYTSPGASSVVQNNDGMWLYNYQVKLNNASNGTVNKDAAELHSHILLHNVNGDPLVTPFEYAGSSDVTLYNDAFNDTYTVSDTRTDGSQVAGQYYVTMSGTDTSTSKSSLGGITLTDGHLVSGAISGSWDFETIRVNGKDYVNGLVITDAKGHEYHGALLRQTVEDDTTLDGIKTTMTFTLAYGNQTIWGVWYDDYQPSSENNADAGLEVSSAIYTGGALALNAVANGQLGLKYGNYITSLKFAEIDYSAYVMIDDEYEIDGVVNDKYQRQDDYSNGIRPLLVQPDGDDATYNEIINAVYSSRATDPNERSSTTGADTAESYPGQNNSESIAQLVDMLSSKANEAQQQGKNLYILTGYLDSADYGRDSENGMDREKGSITLYVTYHETATGAKYSERVYSHVYQQPVPANSSASVYEHNHETHWTHTGDHHYTNSTFLRAEGSYVSDSYYPGGSQPSDIRNSVIAKDYGTKTFAARGIYMWYNPTLFGNNSPVYDPGDASYYHGETTAILRDDDGFGFNDPYRNTASNADITSSYEKTDNANSKDNYFLAAGPRANYYIDLSATSASNIVAYITGNQLTIPLYYSSVPNPADVWWPSRTKTFNYPDGSYMAGLYSAEQYAPTTSNPLGSQSLSSESGYEFSANFDQVSTAYDNGGFQYNDRSTAANILISADLKTLQNQEQSYNSADNAQDTTDYNFYVRTKSELVDYVDTTWGSSNKTHLRSVMDIEYGIYVSDKSYVRNFYNSIVNGKTAGGHTYYSWETFRDATALVADYLNNYMDLADSKADGDNKYDPNGGKETELKAKYDEWMTQHGTNVDAVLQSQDLLDQLLGTYPDEVQDIYCYLLNNAADRLFEYDYFGNYMAAYEEYNMRTNYAEYTSSSWKNYLNIKDQPIMIDGEELDLSLEDLAGYAYAAQDNPQITPEDPAEADGTIYNPFNPDQEGIENDSWKIINDYFFQGTGHTAKEVFLAATAQINEAIGVLRDKADYDALDNAYTEAGNYTGNATIAPEELEGDLAGTGITGVTGYDIFSIDRSTVAALANSMDQGTAVPQDDGNTLNYVADDAGNQYTISAMAAFDKIYQSIWEVDHSITQDDFASYVNSVATGEVDITNRPTGNYDDPNTWYSRLLRDDQQRYADTDDGKQSTDLSEVQTKINDKADLLKIALGWLYSNQITTENLSTYETFDYLIDVISSIDFNAYSDDGQKLLWDALEKLLVKGGVYSVNQQIFQTAPEGTDKAMADLLYGDDGYYTGLNTTNADGYTTELMELLTDLDENYRNDYTITVKVHITDSVNGAPVGEPITQTLTKEYGEEVALSADKLISGYDPADYYVYGWSIETSDSVHNLKNVTSYTFTANQNATINVYVAQMPSPEVGETVPVSVVTKLGGRTELALNVPKNTLSEYSVSAGGATLTVKHNETIIATVDAIQVPFYTFQAWTAGKTSITNTPVTLDTLVEKDAITFMPSYTLNGCEYKITVNGQDYNNLPGVQFDTYVKFSPEDYPAGDLDGTFYAWLVKEGDEYKIASYNKTFWLYATDDEDYVQVNYDESNGNYYIYGGETLTTDKVDAGQPSGDIEAIDPTSLYYRLSHKLLDSWSNMSMFDEVSDKVSLYSHFTDQSDTETTSVKRIESGVLFTDKTAVGADSDQFVMDNMGDSSNRIFKYVASNPSSSGQYVISINVPEYAQKGQTAYMRSYVTYTYTYTNDDGDSTVITRTEYSDVESVLVPGSSSTN